MNAQVNARLNEHGKAWMNACLDGSMEWWTHLCFLFYWGNSIGKGEPEFHFSSVQSLSHVWLFAIPWTAACHASLSITNSRRLLKFLPTESVMSSNHLNLCHPLLLPSIFPSISVFFKELVLCIRWPNYWSSSFSISPSNEHSEPISFRIDWFDLLAIQGTLKSLLQHHSSKASILRCSAFFIVQLSHPYMTTGKTIALTTQTSLSTKWCLCILIHCLGLLYLFFQGASVF